MRALIVCYSYSGNTYRVAQAIQQLTGAELCQIFPSQPYPVVFPQLLEQVKREIQTKYRPSLIGNLRSPREFDTVFVGSPNWCGTIAPPLAAWLRGNDLSGKRVLPFASHCGGVAGDMQKDVAALCPKAQVGPFLRDFRGWGRTLGRDCGPLAGKCPGPLCTRRKQECFIRPSRCGKAALPP